jgi:hypothetical protein
LKRAESGDCEHDYQHSTTEHSDCHLRDRRPIRCQTGATILAAIIPDRHQYPLLIQHLGEG